MLAWMHKTSLYAQLGQTGKENQPVTGNDLHFWRKALGFNKVKAAKRIGISRNSITKWEEENSQIPLTVAYACSAVYAGLKPFSPVGETGEPEAANVNE